MSFKPSYSNSECLFLDKKAGHILLNLKFVGFLLWFILMHLLPGASPSEDLKMLKLEHPKQSPEPHSSGEFPFSRFRNKQKTPLSSFLLLNWSFNALKNLFGFVVTLLGLCPSFVFLFSTLNHLGF